MPEFEEHLVVGVDPGPAQCHAVALRGLPDGGYRIESCFPVATFDEEIRDQWIECAGWYFERVVAQGKSVAQEVFDTAVSCGLVASIPISYLGEAVLVPRQVIGSLLLGGSKGGDAQIAAAIKSTWIGEVGTKKNPGPSWPIKAAGGSHYWAALAVAIFGIEDLRGRAKGWEHRIVRIQ